MQEPSIFTKIYRGEIPGEIIYKDNLCFVILTIDPLTKGHMLVVPVEQIDHLWEVPEPTYTHLFEVARTMAAKITKAYSGVYQRVGMLVDGFGVPHAHIHVLGLSKGIDETILHKVPLHHTVIPEELKVEADKLRAA